MRVLTSVGVAAALAISPATAAFTLERAEAVQEETTVTRTVDTAGEMSTMGFITDLNCFFFRRC